MLGSSSPNWDWMDIVHWFSVHERGDRAGVSTKSVQISVCGVAQIGCVVGK